MAFACVVGRIIVIERIHQLRAHFLHHFRIRRIVACRQDHTLGRIELRIGTIAPLSNYPRYATTVILDELNTRRVEIKTRAQLLSFVGRTGKKRTQALDALTKGRGLTPREMEVLDLISQGYTMRACADTLVISLDTVRSHCKSIYRKLGIHTKQEIINYLTRHTATAKRD